MLISHPIVMVYKCFFKVFFIVNVFLRIPIGLSYVNDNDVIANERPFSTFAIMDPSCMLVSVDDCLMRLSVLAPPTRFI